MGGSNYNGLQVSVRRQFNTRLAVLSTGTDTKTMDDASITQLLRTDGTANSQYPVAGPNFIKDLAVSNIDAKQALNIAMIYTTADRGGCVTGISLPLSSPIPDCR